MTATNNVVFYGMPFTPEKFGKDKRTDSSF